LSNPRTTLACAGEVVTAFGDGSNFTLGVEEGFQFVDPETGELVSRLDEVLEDEDRETGELQSELFQSMIETATPVCLDVDEAREHLARLRGEVADRAREANTRIAASGTHPFARWEQREITPETRYEELIREVRLPIKRELVFGQHVHVAVGSATEAIRVTNQVRAILPLVLAPSTNAPFWRGMDSGLQSARVRVFDAMPRSRRRSSSARHRPTTPPRPCPPTCTPRRSARTAGGRFATGSTPSSSSPTRTGMS